MKKAVVLLSGGLDSTTILAYAKNKHFDCYAISFNYGQRHLVELSAAKKVADFFKVKEHKVITLPDDMFGSSALTDSAIDVPVYSVHSKNEIPVTYVPARNTIFLSIALGYAESIHSHDIFIGVSAIDYSNYPDCRPEYIDCFQKLSNLATKDGVEGKKMTIHTPLIHLSKSETILLGIKNGVDYTMTVSCYAAEKDTGKACGHCDSCTYRKNGFKQAGIDDQTRYRL
jgi:7-cyano-7-deazaguanine synthase